ncbi:Radical SAM superfamily protein [Micromonospora sp. MW-13]|uniref:B12-binding domain-containing radical SAM protein n=1 Tax=Micromonospora sp. MW-13 TaxID=2094022 RepID=UPI000E436D75|nr:radical SAM protein [Micromonospora sp. MW-13]RGC69745.1 Radical SAM superfamily protein [Micromonospora sp. MW-13]
MTTSPTVASAAGRPGPSEQPILGVEPGTPLDLLLVNAPLRDYTLRPRVNDFTLPVLGMGYLATYATVQGFSVGVLDGESLGLGIDRIQSLVNEAAPRWVGFNLLAPTYELSARIAAGLDPAIQVMVGGHQAKAMPEAVIADSRFARLEALIVGEAETRVAELLNDHRQRVRLPGVLWRDPILGTPVTGGEAGTGWHLAPDINSLPFVDRRFFADDPYRPDEGPWEAAMVGARGSPYDCSFCGAAVSANPDVTVRTREPDNIIAEMDELNIQYGVRAFRFVDDFFLGHERFIRRCMAAFTSADVGSRYAWDATGRINILARTDDALLETIAANGCREVALGIESGSERVLGHIGKRIRPELTRDVVRRLTRWGINVKGYFILGLPTETRAELEETVRYVHELWDLTENAPGSFRASVFEFRPYPGTPEWHRLLATGRYAPARLLDHSAVDLQFGEVGLPHVRRRLVELARAQHERLFGR